MYDLVYATCILIQISLKFFIQISLKFVFNNMLSIGLDSGLAPNRQQAIILTNHVFVYWHIYVYLILNGLKVIYLWSISLKTTFIPAWNTPSNITKWEMKLFIHEPKLYQLHHWSLGMDKLFHLTLYNGCNYLSMLGLKLNHTSKMGPWRHQKPSLQQTLFSCS